MRSKPVILVALLLAAFLVNLDTTMVNVALPAMVRQLHATTTQLQWVVDAYNLVFAALLLACGSLSDRFGRKGMLLAGLAVVGAASLAGDPSGPRSRNCRGGPRSSAPFPPSATAHQPASRNRAALGPVMDIPPAVATAPKPSNRRKHDRPRRHYPERDRRSRQLLLSQHRGKSVG